jgi:hypothetical protein
MPKEWAMPDQNFLRPTNNSFDTNNNTNPDLHPLPPHLFLWLIGEHGDASISVYSVSVKRPSNPVAGLALLLGIPFGTIVHFQGQTRD